VGVNFLFKIFKQKAADDTTVEIKLDEERIPKHVAIIMDGNGRWAQKKLLPRVAGHKQGMEVVKEITKTASDLGVKVLTLYAFSTENWKRPASEVNFLMDLPVKFFDKFVPELIEKNVKVNVMGYTDQLPASTRKAVDDAIAQTSQNTGMILNFALNYGSRAEIISGIQTLATEVLENKLKPDEIDEKTLDRVLMTQQVAPYNDPDLLIRTSGEERISNFLLWQIAYSELIFTDVLWPDYKPVNLLADIAKYQARDRRYGGIKETKKESTDK
jgi:undecaprenyl diphosphate synthase